MVLASGIEQRIPFGLVDTGRSLNLDVEDFPVVIRQGARVVYSGTVRGRIVSHDHPAGDADVDHEHASLLRYFALRTTFEEPGIYDLALTVDGQIASMPFQIFDAGDVVVPLPGQVMPAIRVPTFENPLGMNPLCTQPNGPCPLHVQTLEEALIVGGAVALLIATLAVCQTAYCGPVLDVLLELAPEFPSITFLHAEVYENPAEVGFDYLAEGLIVSPTVADLALPFEPALFLIGPDGIIVDRIDNVFDNTELRSALAAL